MSILGTVALDLAFALSVYATIAGVIAGRRGSRRIAASARNACIAAFLATLTAVVALEWGILSHDFTLKVVAEHTSLQLPWFYTVTSLWSSQPGSLLLWLVTLSGATTIVVLQNRTRNRELLPWVIAVLGGVMAFFSGMTALVSSPFERVSGMVPGNGLGLDPSLQNPYMVAHPPALYLGYVSFAVPFAFAMAALIVGRTDSRWLVSVRRWTLVAWASLGVGMLLGAHWAYEEIGWGGYWAWDPVENASLMPWLSGTAFLHSVMVQEKKGMLKIWNIVLVSMTFALSIFGTFLTRSGVINSVHSFVQSAVGPFLLAFVAVIIAFAMALMLWRLPLLRSDHKLESVVSREATFLFNNLLLLALAFTVLWGVAFPILSEAVRGVRSTVSTPYYNFFLVAFGLPLLLLTGVGPMIAWRRASPRSLVRTFRWPVISALSVGALLTLFGFASSVPGLAAFSLCAFVVVTIVLEFVRGTMARQAMAGGGSRSEAFVGLIAHNRRRYGGYIVHLAIVTLAVGITASSAYTTVHERTLSRGESMTVAGYSLTYLGLDEAKRQNWVETDARLQVSRGGRIIGELKPGQRAFPVEQRTSNEVDVYTDWRSGTDLYTILQGTRNGSVTIKALMNPMVNLIWLAGVVFLGGALIVVWPDPREARQLARRYSRLLAREA